MSRLAVDFRDSWGELDADLERAKKRDKTLRDLAGEEGVTGGEDGDSSAAAVDLSVLEPSGLSLSVQCLRREKNALSLVGAGERGRTAVALLLQLLLLLMQLVSGCWIISVSFGFAATCVGKDGDDGVDDGDDPEAVSDGGSLSPLMVNAGTRRGICGTFC